MKIKKVEVIVKIEEVESFSSQEQKKIVMTFGTEKNKCFDKEIKFPNTNRQV